MRKRVLSIAIILAMMASAGCGKSEAAAIAETDKISENVVDAEDIGEADTEAKEEEEAAEPDGPAIVVSALTRFEDQEINLSEAPESADEITENWGDSVEVTLDSGKTTTFDIVSWTSDYEQKEGEYTFTPELDVDESRYSFLEGLYTMPSATVTVIDDTIAEIKYASVAGEVNEDSGEFYIVIPEGLITIDGDVNSAVITPDRTKIIVAMNDGSAYVTDPAQTEKHELDITFNIPESIPLIRTFYTFNDGAYISDGHASYRLSFDDYSLLKNPEGSYLIAYAENSVTYEYRIMGDGMYILKSDSDAPQKVYDLSDDDYMPNGRISDDGEFAFFSEGKADGKTVIYDAGEITEINDGWANSWMSEDQQSMYIVGYNKSYVVKRGGSIWELATGEDAWINLVGVYTAKGLISNSSCDDMDTLYVAMKHTDDDNMDVYRYSEGGDLECIVEDVTFFEMTEGYAIYTTGNRELYIGTFDEDGTLNTKMYSDSTCQDDVYVTEHGGYIYYEVGKKDIEGGGMYCYKAGEDDAVFLSGPVHYISSYKLKGNGLYTSYDGSILYSDAGGNMRSWSYKDEPTGYQSGYIRYVYDNQIKHSFGKCGMINPEAFVYIDSLTLPAQYKFGGTGGSPELGEYPFTPYED